MTHDWLSTIHRLNERMGFPRDWGLTHDAPGVYDGPDNLNQGDTMTEQFTYDELKSFNSTAIDLAAYNNDNNELFIRFTSGGEVTYASVPAEVWVEFLDAHSAGHYYNAEITGTYLSNVYPDGGLKLVKSNYVPEPESEGPVEDAVVYAFPDRTDVLSKTEDNLYGVKYSFGDKGLEGYYETNAYSDQTALLQFYSAIEDAESLVPGIVVNVKVKELTRYFE